MKKNLTAVFDGQVLRPESQLELEPGRRYVITIDTEPMTVTQGDAQDISVEELYEHLQECDEWLAEHFNELIEQYPGKIVAIKGGKVVGVGDDYDDVYRPFWDAGEKIMPLVLEVPYPDDPQEFLL